MGLAVGYLALSYLLLLPVLQTYIIDDDFEGPFAQLQIGATTLSKTLSVGWHASWAGDRTRLVGSVFGYFLNWLYFWLSRTFDITFLQSFAVVKYVALIATAGAAATFWWLAARSYLRAVRWSTAFLLTSIALFTTVQLHGVWSNDPVGGYTMSGYMATTVGFALLTLVVWVTRWPSTRRFLLAAIASVLAVSFYEFNVGAVIGGALILVCAAWAYRGDLRRLAHYLVGTGAFCLAPVVWLLVSGAQNSGSAYAGRALHASGALHTTLLSVVSSLPGAAWRFGSGAWSSAVGTLSVVAALLVVAVLVVWASFGPRDPAPDGWADIRRSNRMLAAVIGAVIIFAIFALALEGSTQLVEQEIPAIGYVYTAYAVGSTAFALLLGVVIWLLAGRRGRWIWFNAGALAIFATFISIQWSFNGYVKDWLNQRMPQNQLLDNSFAGSVPQKSRCEALRNWMSFPWPDYYRAGVYEGTEAGFQAYFGQPMCANLVAPADGFSQAVGPLSNPNWSLLANVGIWDLRAPRCAHGCKGTLSFTAEGVTKPQNVTFTLPNLNPIVIRVPKRPHHFVLPIGLIATYTSVGVSAPDVMPQGATAPKHPIEFYSLKFRRL